MKTLFLALCVLVAAYCQTQNKSGNPTGEIGQPAFDEIIVESTLTVRGKSNSRDGKSLITNPQNKEAEKENKETVNASSVSLARSTREPKQKPFRSPSSSSSAAHTSSNAFNSSTPFGSFGASASQTSSQSQAFGPHGFQGSTGQSASQTYYLPNGSKIDLSFSNSWSVIKGKPKAANSYSFTITGPNGKINRVIF